MRNLQAKIVLLLLFLPLWAVSKTLHLAPTKNFDLIPDPIKLEFNKVLITSASQSSKRNLNFLEKNAGLLLNEQDRSLYLEIAKKDEKFEIRFFLKKKVKKELKTRELVKSDVHASDLVRVMKAGVSMIFQEDDEESSEQQSIENPENQVIPNSLQTSTPDASAIDFKALIEGIKNDTQKALKKSREKMASGSRNENPQNKNVPSSSTQSDVNETSGTERESLLKKIIRIITPDESSIAMGAQWRGISSDALISTFSRVSALTINGEYKKKFFGENNYWWGGALNYSRLLSFPLNAADPHNLRFFFEYKIEKLNSSFQAFYMKEKTFFVNLNSPGEGDTALDLESEWYGADFSVKKYSWNFGARYLFALGARTNYLPSSNQLAKSSGHDIYLLTPEIWKKLKISAIYEKRSLEIKGVIPLAYDQTSYSILAYYPF
jgi:hypothetical protein